MKALIQCDNGFGAVGGAGLDAAVSEVPRLRSARDGDVIKLTLCNGPEGVLDDSLVCELEAAVAEIERLDRPLRPRVLLLSGEVPGVFVRRYAVEELLAGAAAGDEPHALQRLIARLEALELVTVAALHGTTLGGGFELALGCDFRLACEGPYRFGLRETEVGLVPGAGGTQRLVREIGVAKTLELVLLSKLLKPQEALALGLLHHVFEREEFAVRVGAFCLDIARRAPIALALAKRAIRRGAELPLAEALLLEQRASAASARTEDARNAVQAYGQGRSYVFHGR